MKTFLLQSFSKFDEVGEFDPEINSIRVRPKSSAEISQINGTYCQLGGQLFALYRAENRLILKVAGAGWFMDEVSIVLSGENQRTLKILKGNALLNSVSYEHRPLNPPLDEDLTPFVEEEHFDFGLLLANLSKSPERQNRFYSLD